MCFNKQQFITRVGEMIIWGAVKEKTELEIEKRKMTKVLVTDENKVLEILS
jgi:hypothetical protein